MNRDELYGRSDELLSQIRALQDEVDRTPANHPDWLGLTRAVLILTRSLEDLRKVQPVEAGR